MREWLLLLLDFDFWRWKKKLFLIMHSGCSMAESRFFEFWEVWVSKVIISFWRFFRWGNDSKMINKQLFFFVTDLAKRNFDKKWSKWSILSCFSKNAFDSFARPKYWIKRLGDHDFDPFQTKKVKTGKIEKSVQFMFKMVNKEVFFFAETSLTKKNIKIFLLYFWDLHSRLW